jgi:hypothetical protein
MNGFGTRVLWIFVDRRRIVPNLEPIPQEVLTPLVRRIREALVAGRKAGAVRRSPDADDLWADLYRRMADDDGAGLVDALTARAEAQVLRLSLIYALTDGKNEIARGHLEAAWEVWRYCRWSAQRVWVGRGTGDPDVDRIAAILAGGQDLTSTGLDRMFNGHRNTEELRDKVVGFGIGQVVRRSTGGRDAIVLTSAENEEKAEKGSDLRLWWTRPTFLRPPQEHVTDVTDVTLHATATGDFPSVPIDPLSQGSLAEELGAYVRNWNAGMQRWDDGHEG